MKLLAYVSVSSHEGLSECEDYSCDEKRGACRLPFDCWVVMVTSVDPDLHLSREPINVCVFLRSQDISMSGMSVVGSSVLEPAMMVDYAPLLKLDQLFGVGTPCKIGLPSGNDLDLTWVNAEVVRDRNTGSNDIELGLRFLTRLESDCPDLRDVEQLFGKFRVKQSRLQSSLG